MPDDLEIQEFTLFCEKRGYRPHFNVPIIGPSSNVRVYYDNKVTAMSVSYETANLIINRPEGILEFPEGRKPVEIKETYPFLVLNLLLKYYPDVPSKKQIAEETCGITRSKQNRFESIRGYFKELRRIVGRNILLPGARQFNSAVKIVEIFK